MRINPVLVPANPIPEAVLEESNQVQKSLSNPQAETQPTNRQKEAVKEVQKEFLKQVNSGKSPKEAFFDSLKAMYTKKEAGDSFEKVHCNATARAITPEAVTSWLNVIGLAVPILVSIFDFIIHVVDTVVPKTKCDANNS